MCREQKEMWAEPGCKAIPGMGGLLKDLECHSLTKMDEQRMGCQRGRKALLATKEADKESKPRLGRPNIATDFFSRGGKMQPQDL